MISGAKTLVARCYLNTCTSIFGSYLLLYCYNSPGIRIYFGVYKLWFNWIKYQSTEVFSLLCSHLRKNVKMTKREVGPKFWWIATLSDAVIGQERRFKDWKINQKLNLFDERPVRMKLQVGKVLPLDRNDMYQMIKTSEGSNGQPGLFFCLFSFFTNHIRTQIVGAESEHADHKTTTTTARILLQQVQNV